MSVHLEVVKGPDEGKVFDLPRNTSFVVGREVDESAGFRLPSDPYMSRHHFLAVVGVTDCTIRDCGSSNGLFVNDVKVRAAHLRDGDRVQAGHTIFVVRLVPEAAAGELQPLEVRVEDRYELGNALASGGGARVFRATDRESGEQVVVKFVRIDVTDAANRMPIFLRELEAAKSLQHAHIVPVVAVGLMADEAWLASRFVDGPTLAERVEWGPLLSERQGLELALHLLEAVGYAHAMGFVHRDVKPANVMLGRESYGYRPMLTDFGLSKRTAASPEVSLTTTGTVRGTPRYMPPEQLRNSRAAGPAADLFALAATVYYAVSGQWHYDESEEGVLSAILEGEAIPIRKWRRRVSHEMEHVLHKGLAKEPDQRYPSAAAFRDVVFELLGTLAAREGSGTTSGKRPPGR